MALCHKWVVKNNFDDVLQFFSLISDGQGSVLCNRAQLAFLMECSFHNIVSKKSKKIWANQDLAVPIIIYVD